MKNTQQRPRLLRGIAAAGGPVLLALYPALMPAQEDMATTTAADTVTTGVDSATTSIPASAGVTELEDIVVTAAGFGQLEEDAPASISTITREEMEQKAYTDITDAIKDLPGVVLTGGGTSQDISIRGMAPSYTMILVDGKRINSRETRPNSDGPGIEQGWLPPLAAIDRVEVIRGPMSSLYGSDAMGGIVNIITRKVPAQRTGKLRLEGTVQQDSDAGNSLQGGAYLAGPLIDDVLGLQVYGSRSGRREDDILNGFGQLDEKAGNIKLSWRLNEHNDITAESGYSHQRRQSTKGRS